MWTERNTNGSCPRLPPRPGPWPEIPKAEGRRNILRTFCQRTVLVPCKPPKRATNPGKGLGGVNPARRDLGRPSDPKPGPRNLKISTRPCLPRNPPSRCRTFDHHRPSPDDPIPLLFRGPQGQNLPPGPSVEGILCRHRTNPCSGQLSLLRMSIGGRDPSGASRNREIA